MKNIHSIARVFLMNRYTYLDLNSISNLVDVMLKDKNGFALVGKLSRFTIPFSVAHLLDLSSKHNSNSAQQTNELLNRIKLITNNYAVNLSEDFSEITLVKSDVHKAYIYQLNNPKPKQFMPDISFNMGGNEYLVDRSKIKNKESIIYSILESNDWKINSCFFEKFLAEYILHIDDTSYYKKLRRSMTALLSEYNKQENPLVSKKSTQGRKLIKILRFFSDRKLTTDKFMEFLNLHFEATPQPFDELSKMDKYRYAYKLLDFNIEYHDKLRTGNSIDNLERDLFHYRFIENSDLYVTDDKTSRKKIKFLATFFNLNTRILSTDEFIEHINTSY